MCLLSPHGPVNYCVWPLATLGRWAHGCHQYLDLPCRNSPRWCLPSTTWAQTWVHLHPSVPNTRTLATSIHTSSPHAHRSLNCASPASPDPTATTTTTSLPRARGETINLSLASPCVTSLMASRLCKCKQDSVLLQTLNGSCCQGSLESCYESLNSWFIACVTPRPFRTICRLQIPLVLFHFCVALAIPLLVTTLL